MSINDVCARPAGGSILSTRCSETYQTKAALLSLFGVPLWYFSQSPRAVIQVTLVRLVIDHKCLNLSSVNSVFLMTTALHHFPIAPHLKGFSLLSVFLQMFMLNPRIFIINKKSPDVKSVLTLCCSSCSLTSTRGTAGLLAALQVSW